MQLVHEGLQRAPELNCAPNHRRLEFRVGRLALRNAMEIFGEFEEEEVVTSDWYFRPAKRAENSCQADGASSRHPQERVAVRQFDDATRFGSAVGGESADQPAKGQIATAQPHYINRDLGKRSAKEIRASKKFSGISEVHANGQKLGLTNAAVLLY
jgi:hypothetical protein